MRRADMSPAEPESDRERALKSTPVSRETAARLDRFVDLLRQWQQKTNLISPATLPEVWTRHVADSLQLLRFAPAAKTWVDLGSGGGFPGLALACALTDRPGTVVHLVESNGKKCAFLREAVRATGVRAIVHCERIESFVASFHGTADVVTARALAPLETLLAQADPLLKTGAVGLFPKGQDVGAELTQASKCWNITADLEPSLTSEDGRIVIVKKLERRPPKPGQ